MAEAMLAHQSVRIRKRRIDPDRVRKRSVMKAMT